MGFSAGGMSDAIAGRAGAIEQAARVKEQRAQGIATARRAADAATEARKAECAPIRGPRCREREADERAALAALNAAIAIPLPSTVSISAADPGAGGSGCKRLVGKLRPAQGDGGRYRANLGHREGGHARVRGAAAFDGDHGLATPKVVRGNVINRPHRARTRWRSRGLRSCRRDRCQDIRKGRQGRRPKQANRRPGFSAPHWSRRRDSRGQWRRPPPPRSSRWCPADTTDFRPRFSAVRRALCIEMVFLMLCLGARRSRYRGPGGSAAYPRIAAVPGECP